MIGRSLRFRLLAGAGAAIFAALSLAWLAMSVLFEAHIERNVEASLIQHGRDLVAALARDPFGALIVESAPADPRFDLPASGLYWQVAQGDAILRSRSLWDQTMAPGEAVATEDWTTGDAAGPFGQKLVFVARRVLLHDGDAPIVVMLGADHAAVTAARTTFSRDLALFLLVLWAALAAAAWLQVKLGLKPLDDVRAALADMQSHPGARLSQEAYPSEAAPLAQAINALAEARERNLERAKRRAADLAHALRTPLAAMTAMSRRARKAGAVDAADGMDRAIEAARFAVERELTRARLAAERNDASTEARPVVERLLAVVARTKWGARLSLENDIAAAPAPVSEAVLMEIAGPLLENAARFARTRVRVAGGAGVLTIDDDGPGLTEAQMTQALERGRRLDQSEPGYGLGLAIAKAAVEASGGELRLGVSPLGGLRTEIHWRQAEKLSAGPP